VTTIRNFASTSPVFLHRDEGEEGPVEDALHATRAAVEEGIVRGGRASCGAKRWARAVQPSVLASGR
jgi:chaperonin GroEL (HSP60 family)